jgi:hypothetical protein
MEYKGQYINDTEDVNRYEKVDKFTKDFSNEIELGIEELDELKDLIRKKESELKEKGVKFSDVKIEMSGYDARYEDPSEFITVLSWKEEENEEEKEKRIQLEKQRIYREERVRMEKLAAAVKVIEENGGTVKNLKI